MSKNIEKMFEQLVLIRKFEEKVLKLFSRGLLFGTTHPYIGQEANAVGIINALKEEDIITGNHRSHGHYIAYIDDVEGLMMELMGKEGGVCGGRGGTQHLQKRNFYSNGIAGGMPVVATGMALAEKKKKSGNIVIAFMGDGMLGHGAFYEAINMASLWNLPIVYVVENNFYAMSTHISKAVAGKIVDRGKAFGLGTKEISTNDVEEVYDTSLEISEEIRKKHGPFIFVCNTYRLLGHSKADDRCYRARSEEEEWKKKDPIRLAGEKLDKEVRNKIEEKCKKRIEKAVEIAIDADIAFKERIEEGLYV